MKNIIVIENKYKSYLDTIKGAGTKTAATTLLKKLECYTDEHNISDIQSMKRDDVDNFLKEDLKGKSPTTIGNTISRIKHLFAFYGCEEETGHLNLYYVKGITNTKEIKYLTPGQVYNLIESLINYQDKALVLMCYMDLYDKDFETIRNAKRDNFKGNKLYLDNDRCIKLNDYCSFIIQKAIEEDVMEKYIFQDGRNVKPYNINTSSPYILTSKERKGKAEILPSITLKKRFEVFAKHSNIDKLSAVMLKNSRIVYEMIKREYEENFGFDINQLEIKNHFKENNIIGQVEVLNMRKKEMKSKIINEIITGKTVFID